MILEEGGWLILHASKEGRGIFYFPGTIELFFPVNKHVSLPSLGRKRRELDEKRPGLAGTF